MIKVEVDNVATIAITAQVAATMIRVMSLLFFSSDSLATLPSTPWRSFSVPVAGTDNVGGFVSCVLNIVDMVFCSFPGWVVSNAVVVV